jgi:hypothetical protein
MGGELDGRKRRKERRIKYGMEVGHKMKGKP